MSKLCVLLCGFGEKVLYPALAKYDLWIINLNTLEDYQTLLNSYSHW